MGQRSVINAIQIPAAEYPVGSNSIPNASPKHRRSMAEFWIDRQPVSFGHLERFVCGAGFTQSSLWQDLPRCDGSFLQGDSVDQRCEQIYEHSLAAAKLLRQPVTSSEDLPLVGMTWMEAIAVCRFFNAHLPFESQWETAMTPCEPVKAETHSRAWSGFPVSQTGAVIVVGVLQEWTADAYSPRYWRSDSDSAGETWTPADRFGVSLRGATRSDMHQDYRFRRAADPTIATLDRGFRRVWSSQPTAEQVSPRFQKVSS